MHEEVDDALRGGGQRRCFGRERIDFRAFEQRSFEHSGEGREAETIGGT
jgi:hypothetical protein